MKKVLALMLALVLVLSLAACGGSSDESSGGDNLDASNAIVETPQHICRDAKENQVKVKQNTYIMTCTVDEVTESYFECAENADSMILRVCLDTDSLAKLNKGDQIAIIGKITSFEEGNYGWKYAMFGEAEIYEGTVSDVKPREDDVFTGELIAGYMSSAYKWDIKIDGETYDITFANGEKVHDLDLGDIVTFSCEDYTGYSFPNAKIISVK